MPTTSNKINIASPIASNPNHNGWRCRGTLTEDFDERADRLTDLIIPPDHQPKSCVESAPPIR